MRHGKRLRTTRKSESVTLTTRASKIRVLLLEVRKENEAQDSQKARVSDIHNKSK